MSLALVVGRFQPFHKGHLWVLRHVLAEGFEPLVVIGSSQAAHTFRDPFTFEERQQMLEAVMVSEGIQGTVTGLEDLGDPPRWAQMALDRLPDFTVVFSNDELTREAFKAHGIEVRPIPHENRGRFQGTRIREQLAKDDLAWREAVPQVVSQLLDAFGGVQRLNSLSYNEETT